MHTLSHHLSVGFYGCDPDKLDDLALVRQAMLTTAGALETRCLGETFCPVEPRGVSGAVIAAESRLSIHTWPEHGYAAVDIFTSGRLDPSAGISMIEAALAAGSVRVETTSHGLPDPIEAGPLRPDDIVVHRSPTPPSCPRLGLHDGWFTEGATPFSQAGAVQHALRAQRVRCHKRTAYQDIVIFDNPTYGRVLSLDGIVQLSTADERIYHELLVHPAMLTHPAPRTVLVVGGGDGGCLREVLRHDPEEVVLAELDPQVVALCREHLPGLSEGAFDDPRVSLVFEDAALTLRRYAGHFDVILVDGSDDVGPSEPLFGEAFFADLRRALRPGGTCAAQGGAFLDLDLLRATFTRLSGQLGPVATFRVDVPCFHGGDHAFFLAAPDGDPRGPEPDVLESRLRERGLEGTLQYYSPAVHHAAQVLPPAHALR